MSALHGRQIRPCVSLDRDWMLRLNNAAVPAVNALTAGDLDWLLEEAALTRVVDEGGSGLGLVVTFDETASYQSPNYRWFKDRYPAFVYVDRIVIADAARGLGLGQALYERVFEEAARRGVPVACEVNERPPNPGSQRFHTRIGFRIVGRQETNGGEKAVAMMLRGG